MYIGQCKYSWKKGFTLSPHKNVNVNMKRCDGLNSTTWASFSFFFL
jgi:hypothetical protein